MPSRLREKDPSSAVRTYKIGFSLVGFIAVLLPQIPNVVWAILPPVSSVLPENRSALPFVDVAGTASQIVMIALLILVINTRHHATTNSRVPAAVAIACLIGYLGSWVLYFTQPISPILLLMMAILPSVYFICVGLYLKNFPSLLPAALFAVIHISTTAAVYF